MTKAIAYWRDDSPNDGKVLISRGGPYSAWTSLAIIESSFDESGVRLSYCPGAGGCTIWKSEPIDNQTYYYKVHSIDPGADFELVGVKIHYTTKGPH